MPTTTTTLTPEALQRAMDAACKAGEYAELPTRVYDALIEGWYALQERPSGPSYEALDIIARSVAGALERAGVTDCDDPGEAIDVLRERYERRIAELQAAPAATGVSAADVHLAAQMLTWGFGADGLTEQQQKDIEAHQRKLFAALGSAGAQPQAEQRPMNCGQYLDARREADKAAYDKLKKAEQQAVDENWRREEGIAPEQQGAGPDTDGGRNMFYEGRFEGETERQQKARLYWADEMRAAFERRTGNGWFDTDWRNETGLWAAAWNCALAARQPAQAEQQGAGDALVASLRQIMDAEYDGLGRLPTDVLGVLNMAVEALAARQPVEEPVAEIVNSRYGGGYSHSYALKWSHGTEPLPKGTKLYTAPTAAVDLSPIISGLRKIAEEKNDFRSTGERHDDAIETALELLALIGSKVVRS